MKWKTQGCENDEQAYSQWVTELDYSWSVVRRAAVLRCSPVVNTGTDQRKGTEPRTSANDGECLGAGEWQQQAGVMKGVRVVQEGGVEVFGKQHGGVRRKLMPPPGFVVNSRMFAHIIWWKVKCNLDQHVQQKLLQWWKYLH